MLLIIWFILQSWISGYRDMVRFVYKGTWDRDRLASWVPYWVSPQSSKKDPFHFAGGLMWTLIIALIFFEAIYHFITHNLFIIQPVFIIGIEWYWLILTFAIHVAMFWVGFYWQRNLMMHIWGVSKQYNEWKYLNPFWKTLIWLKKLVGIK